jgi:hypothetical protein
MLMLFAQACSLLSIAAFCDIQLCVTTLTNLQS